MTDITAKVKVCGKSKSTLNSSTGESQWRLLFDADYEDPANKAWALATPSINIGMTTKSEIAKLFEQGLPVTVTFHVEDKAPPAENAMKDYPLPSEGLDEEDPDGNKGMC